MSNPFTDQFKNTLHWKLLFRMRTSKQFCVLGAPNYHRSPVSRNIEWKLQILQANQTTRIYTQPEYTTNMYADVIVNMIIIKVTYINAWQEAAIKFWSEQSGSLNYPCRLKNFILLARYEE